MFNLEFEEEIMDNWTVDFSQKEAEDIFSSYYGECEDGYTERELKEIILDLLGVEEDHNLKI